MLMPCRRRGDLWLPFDNDDSNGGGGGGGGASDERAVRGVSGVLHLGDWLFSTVLLIPYVVCAGCVARAHFSFWWLYLAVAFARGFVSAAMMLLQILTLKEARCIPKARRTKFDQTHPTPTC